MVTSLIDAETIATRIGDLAEEIIADLPEQALLAPILTGAFIFAADLSRALAARGRGWDVDFLHLSSYGDAQVSSGSVRLIKDLQRDVAGQTVLLIDDVLDSGHSLAFAKKLVEGRGAVAKICVLVRKDRGRDEHVEADFVGFDWNADAFLVGYGMDNAGAWRGLPYVGAV